MKSSLVWQFVVDTRKHFSKHEGQEWNGTKDTSKLTVPNCVLAVHLDSDTESNSNSIPAAVTAASPFEDFKRLPE